MQTFELITALLAVVVGLVWLSDRYHVPYPMVLMAGGLVLAVLPWTPDLELEPEIVLMVFLPPILFQAAQLTSLRDFRTDFGPISRLAIGLVIVTTGAVAIVAHAVIPGIGWAAAFTLGAIVSPPDAVAATAIFQRLGAPRRIVSILEGESLINDASAIVLYTFAVAAVVTGRFSMTDALLEFVVVVVVGVLVGALVGRVMGRVIMILGDPSLVTLMTLIIPAATYVLAEQLGGSGVLAVVTAGLVHGFTQSFTMTPNTRLRSNAIWDLMTVAVNGFVFLLIGFELGALRDTLSSQRIWELTWHALVVFLTVVAVRFVYVYAGRRVPDRQNRGEWVVRFEARETFLIAWSGLRGVVSLATALALPLLTNTGTPFDHRDEIILIAAGVIILSMYGLGLPLPAIVRRLNFSEDTSVAVERRLAYRVTREAMFTRMKQRAMEQPEYQAVYGPMIAEMQKRMAERKEEDAGWPSGDEADADIVSPLRPSFDFMQDGLDAARQALFDLRVQGRISDEVSREVEQSLDLQALQFSAHNG
ncbi:MAG: Na+/H+ antiporter [Thermomicrobiales bacterium]